MPYKKSYRRRRRYAKKGTKTQYAVAMRAIRAHERKVVELKHHDFFLAATPIATTGDIRGISIIPQGSLQNNREGSRVFCKTAFLRFEVVNPDTDPKGVRIIVFRWLRPTSPTLANILQTTASAPYLQPLNQENSNFINVLYDKFHSVAGKTSAGSIRTFKVFLNVNRSVHFQASSNSNEKGNLYVAAISNSSLNDPTVGYVSRVRYTDQ